MRTVLYAGAWLLTALSFAAPPIALVAIYNWTLVLRWDATQKAQKAREAAALERRRRKAEAARLRAIRSWVR